METNPIRVLLTDDHAIVRKGVRALLATERDIQVVGEACSGKEAVAQAEALCPDVILMDLVMPELDGIEATRQIMAKQPGAHILILTSFAADEKVFPAIKAGALGYLLKDSGPEELVEAIRRVNQGEPSLEPSIARKVLMELSHRPKQQPLSADPLSEREFDVLRLIAKGCSNKEIALKLSVSDLTVRTHVSNILAKLHLASRTQAALYALQKGITSLEDIPALEDY